MKKSEVNGDSYCCVHNVDCPRHGDSDVMVLVVNPNSIPKSWMCPNAVLDISDREGEAHEYI